MFKTLLIWNSQHDHRDVVKNVQEGDHRVPEEETQIIGVATAQQDSTLEVFALIVFFFWRQTFHSSSNQTSMNQLISFSCSESFDADMPIDPQAMDR